MRRPQLSTDDTLARLRILLGHWIDHNREHGEEFREWADRVREVGEAGAGDDIAQAAQEMEKAGELLARALEKLGGREA